MTAQEILAALECDCPCHAATRRGRGATHCPGPGHANGDAHPSLSVDESENGTTLVNCKTTDSQEEVIDALSKRGLWRPSRRYIEATYDYHDSSGVLLYQVVRFQPKGFAQRRPVLLTEGEEWAWNMQGVTRVLYRLPEVLKAIEKAHRIYVVEGEKDVDALFDLGVVATCNSGGAGKWEDSYAADLTGADVVVIPDKDEAGRKHAQLVVSKIRGAVKSVKLVELPGDAVKDASDWIEAGGTKAALEELAGLRHVF